MHNFCAGLRAYHMIGLPPARPGVRPTYLSLYIYDANELDDRMHLDVAKDLQRGTMERLQRMLHSRNPFVQCFKAINMANFGPNVNIVLHADVGMHHTTTLSMQTAMSMLNMMMTWCICWHALEHARKRITAVCDCCVILANSRQHFCRCSCRGGLWAFVYHTHC